MRQLKIGSKITRRDAASLDKYLNEISKIELLTNKEEVELAIKIKTGDQLALERMIKCNLRFVVSIAKHYQYFGLSLGDLINEGNLGLIKAAGRFDETRGFKFISFAVLLIRHSMISAIKDQTRTIRLPQNMYILLSKINKAMTILQQELERIPSIAEVSERIHMDEEKIKDCLDNSRLSISLDSIVDDEIGNTLLDVLKNDAPDTDSVLIHESLNYQVKMLLSPLSKKEREILKLAFGLENRECVKLEDIADQFNLSGERIRQMKDGAIKRLRNRAKMHFTRINHV